MLRPRLKHGAGKSVNYFPRLCGVHTRLYWRREIEPGRPSCWSRWPIDSLAAGITCYLGRRSTHYPAVVSSGSSFLAICRPICRPLWPQLHLRQLHIPALPCLLVYRTVRGCRIDGKTGKGCQVARSGHIDQLPRRTRAAARPAAPYVVWETWMTSCRDAKRRLRTTRDADHDAHLPQCEQRGNCHQWIIKIDIYRTPTTYTRLIETGQRRVTSSSAKRAELYLQPSSHYLIPSHLSTI